MNPGTTSKKRATGTYAQFCVYPRKVTDEERTVESTMVGHKVFDRARVDIFRI